MLPERFMNRIESTEKKDGSSAPRYTRFRAKRKPGSGRSLSLLCAAMSICISLVTLGTLAVDVFCNRTALARPIMDMMLYAAFPTNGTPSDIPASLPLPTPESDEDTTMTIPEETTSAPAETKTPQTTAAPEEMSTPLPEGAYPIVSVDLSAPELGEFYISNETPYTPDIEFLSQNDDTLAAISDLSESAGPLVLIIHTHATEAYSEEGATYYDADSIAPRSENPAENVIAVGSVMASVFRENGIPTLHCTVMHDKDSYKDSYNRAAATIKEYLAKYPTIRYVFDVHRDSLIRENGDKLRTVVDIGGNSVAQVMSVVGTDYKGAAHASWETNLTLAAILQSRLNENFFGLARHIYLRGASFNQQYTSGSLLLEIGSCANSLDEAKRAGSIVAEVLSGIIKGN